ncbi:MAG: hypothetical protein AMK72_04865 [Planctomycetes bacterium SM23_25]|nr:MAG: hypothetical protein AMK72_04865 [Planctomycetes bacterium SM23_25]
MIVGMVAYVTGCSSKASEDKPLDQVKAEAQKMNADQLQAKVAEYKQAIEAKKPEIEKLQKELGTGLTGVLSGKKPENADELKAKLEKLQASVKALTERMEIYASELKSKQGG